MHCLDGSAHLYRLDELYRDDRMLVVNKPSGLSVHKGWDSDPVNAVKLARKLAGQYVHPVHRLDRATSGCLVFAFDGETAGRLQDHFRDKTISKRYLALARGVVPDEIRIDHPVPRKPKGERVDAVTNVRRLGIVEDRYSLIEACPETGRLHQIRRHLKHLSHPLVGDTRYGDGSVNRSCRDRFGLLRLALHAVQIDFRHPHHGTPITIYAPPPDDFRVPLERMGFSTTAWAA
ncbi:MAG: pseudouridylate synthase [Sandaracinaceae bacterium]|nr:pseudouridylate synthase [Sandaracinaceae bacterium]